MRASEPVDVTWKSGVDKDEDASRVNESLVHVSDPVEMEPKDCPAGTESVIIVGLCSPESGVILMLRSLTIHCVSVSVCDSTVMGGLDGVLHFVIV
jgi:hypothetical protein